MSEVNVAFVVTNNREVEEVRKQLKVLHNNGDILHVLTKEEFTSTDTTGWIVLQNIIPDKTHALILDFAGNTQRIGPINNPEVPTGGRGNKKGKGKFHKAKKCPRCKALAAPAAKYCMVCKHEFIFKTKLKRKFDKNAEIVQKEENPWLKVDRVNYYIHHKVGSPNSLKVSYTCGSFVYNEWICLNHRRDPKVKADNWVTRRGMLPSVPYTTEDVYANKHLLIEPSHIKIKRGKYVEITNARF